MSVTKKEPKNSITWTGRNGHYIGKIDETTVFHVEREGQRWRAHFVSEDIFSSKTLRHARATIENLIS